MAVLSGTLNMAQWALLSNEPLVEAVTFSLIDNGSVMARDIPWSNKQTLVANGVRFEGNLPTPNWSPLNAEGVVSLGTPNPFQEVAYIIRNYVDVDKNYVLDQNQITEPRAIQAQAVLKAIAYDFNFQFIGNNHVSGNQNAPVGIRYRIDNPSTYGVRTAAKIDAGGVDLSVAGMTAATANSFLEFLDQLLWSVDAPNGNANGINNPAGPTPGVVLYMNDVTLRRFRRALRLMGTSGGLDITQDSFNRSVESYKGCPIYDIGYKIDQATRIITTTETAAGVDGASTFTSIYAVNYGPGHFMGWQFGPLNVQDLGLLNSGVIYRTLVDWAGGFINQSNRSIGRLYDIKLA
jgi:hypothetical protein